MSQRSNNAVALLAAGLMLAGCAADQSRPASRPVAALPASTTATQPATPQSTPTVTIKQPETAPAEVVILTPDEPWIDDNPARLIGLDHQALETLLGAPGFLREEPPAQVWQYRGDSCVLDVYLYGDGTGDHYRVTYFEIRGATGDAARRACFRQFVLTHMQG